MSRSMDTRRKDSLNNLKTASWLRILTVMYAISLFNGFYSCNVFIFRFLSLLFLDCVRTFVSFKLPSHRTRSHLNYAINMKVMCFCGYHFS